MWLDELQNNNSHRAMKTEARLTSDLPEQYARLYDYHTGKFETPLDPRGIANIDAIFDLAIRTYPDELPSFSSSERNIHHVYWTEDWWRRYSLRNNQRDNQTIHEFRNSTPQLAYIPVPIHDWIEETMIPPPPPHIEVMRQRNAAWKVAASLLIGVNRLDKARDDYDKKKDTTRTVLGNIHGITPRSKQRSFTTEERLNREYWLSELNGRLEGWRFIADRALEIPTEYRFVTEPRLMSVRALSRRISKTGAMLPRIPADFAAA